ncbi:MAG: hypothetical protein V3T20_04055 [Gemmatimonadota bacterium]
MTFGESLVVWRYRRRYLREMRRKDGRPRYEELSADATARLSIDGLHHLQEILKDERAAHRKRGDNRAADSLTSAVRGLDSRVQILDDMLR